MLGRGLLFVSEHSDYSDGGAGVVRGTGVVAGVGVAIHATGASVTATKTKTHNRSLMSILLI